MRSSPSDFSDLECHGCQAELLVDEFSGVTIYHLLNTDDDIALCQSCYDKLPDLLTKTDVCLSCCKLCFEDMDTKSEFWNLGEFYTCTECLPMAKRAFIPLTREVLSNIYCTRRGCTYRYSNQTNLVFPSVIMADAPDILKYLDSLVRPPYFDWDAAEWRFCSKLDEVPSYNAECGFAVRCIENQHQVASIVCDNHGRTAMNIVFNSVEEFLEAEEQWRSERLPEDERINAVKAVQDTRRCDNSLLLNATNSFAVYTRIKRCLPMYYG